ncbi:MAG: D-glycero-beta-D-manno-heptose 1-phosphate adenylyltransferase [bacterium]
MELKLVSRGEIGEISRREKARGRTISFTNGCFDLIHPGHIYCLYSARREGDLLVVGINGDDSVRRLKGPPRPVFPQEERAEILSSFPFVDYVVIFNEDTPLRLVRTVMPHVLVKGGDYRPEDVVGRKEVEDNGGRLVIIPPLPGFSSTALIRKIAERAERTRRR